MARILNTNDIIVEKFVYNHILMSKGYSCKVYSNCDNCNEHFAVFYKGLHNVMIRCPWCNYKIKANLTNPARL